MFILALIGFVKAKSIAGALATKLRKTLDSNQRLIGQGLRTTAASFFQFNDVSGSFPRSAVAGIACADNSGTAFWLRGRLVHLGSAETTTSMGSQLNSARSR